MVNVKAFDKVSHKHLAIILDYYDSRDSTLAWIKYFLTNRKLQVVLDGIASVDVTSAVLYHKGLSLDKYCF